MTRHLSELSVEREVGLGVYRDDQLERRILEGAGRFVGIIFPATEPVAAGDVAGGWFLVIPADLNGTTLVDPAAGVYTPSSADMEMQVRNVTQAADMLNTPITIEAGDNTSYPAGTQPVVNPATAVVATGDIVVVDVDDEGSGAQGLDIILAFA